ncbi:HotDog domain-containing protein [Pyrenochaeta sp. MPI-SDFR-AT-0127]|nr:HotDog domain-containing protein [Pyrenochaeta sp. MPI-SDFR-AT-0127]
MVDTIISRLSSAPWAAALINDPSWTPAKTTSRLPKPSGEDSFIAETLGTDRTIRTLLTLRPSTEEDGDFVYKKAATIVDLGDGLNGYPQILHGGFVATLLDEVCGVLIVLNLERRSQRLRDLGHSNSDIEMGYFTAYLNTTYKKPIPAPGIIFCMTKIEREEGRKIYVRATIEDGSGTVYTEGEAMFIRVKNKL